MNRIEIDPGQSIDPYLRANRSNTKFKLREGEYFTEGSFAFEGLDHSMLAPGCEIEGSGSKRTLIRAASVKVPSNGTQIECLTAGSRTGACQNVYLSGFTVAPFPEERTTYLGVIGLHVWSDRCELYDIATEQITGCRTIEGVSGFPSREGFGLLVNASGLPEEGRVGGSRIIGVRVEVWDGFRDQKLGEHYVCGCYVGVKDPDDATIVSDVSVINRSSTEAHAAFGVNGAIFGRNWRNLGSWNRAIFCDVTGGTGTLIESSFFSAGRVAVEFRGSKVDWDNILIRGSHFKVQPIPGAKYVAGLVLVDDGGSSFSNVRIEDSVIVGDQWSVNATPAHLSTKDCPFYIGSADCPDIDGCGVKARFVGQWAEPQITKRTPKGGFAVQKTS